MSLQVAFSKLFAAGQWVTGGQRFVHQVEHKMFIILPNLLSISI